MARIPTRFHGPALVTNTAATKYTVAAAEKIVLRHIHVQNPSASAIALTISIGADAAAARIFDTYTIPASSPFDHFCYYPVEAGEIIQAFAGTNNVLTLTVSGDRLVLG